MKMSLSETFKSQIEMLALQLAQAMVEANAASAVVTVAEAHRETIATRVAALAGDREAILGRRGCGQRSDEDGAALALIQADTESLQPILQEASERVRAAEARCAGLSASASHIRMQIARIEAQAVREALIEHASILAGKLFETINAITAANHELGHTGRPLWGAPPELYLALRRLASERGEL
jgi:uncharacterized protein YukE